MHHVLHVHEIISIIFEQLYLDGQGPTLASLARTCHSFTEPALDLLWKGLETLGPLVQCMPPDLWELVPWEDPDIEEDEPYVTRVLTFIRPLKDADWSRAMYYGSKIHRLGFSRVRDYTLHVHQDIFFALSEYRPARIPFPNLSEVIFDLDFRPVVQAIPYAHLFLRAQITRVEIDGELQGPTDSPLVYLLELLTENCPNIQELHVTSLQTDIPAFHQLVCRLSGLRVLKVPLFDPSNEMIIHLGKLQKLTALATIQIPSDIRLIATDRGSFASLHDFNFVAQTWPNASSLIASMNCAFEFLDIRTVARSQSLTDLALFTNSISMHRSASSLVSLNIHGLQTMADVDDNESSVAGVLRPLFSLTKLQFVELDLPITCALNDSWLSDVATAWPSLRTLYLDGDASRNPGMTLAGLIPLVKHCPYLSGLSLQVNAKPVNPGALCGVHNAKVKYLTFWDSPITSPEELVFRSLIDMFPRLRAVLGSYRDVGTPWETVNSLLKKRLSDGDPSPT